MRLLLRCDGGPSIGVGHVVRSLAVAEAAVARGHEVAVLGRLEGEMLGELVAALGPRVVLLGPSPSDEPQALAQAAAGYDVLHVDHYDLPGGLLAAIRALDVSVPSHLAPSRPVPSRSVPSRSVPSRSVPSRPVSSRPVSSRPVLSVVTDGVFGGQPADLLLDPTIDAQRSPAPAPATWHLRGSRFVALRTSVTRFRGVAPAAQPHTGAVVEPRVLVVLGGTDPERCAPWVVDALEASGVPLHVRVVSTPATHDDLVRRAQAWHGRLVVTPPAADLPEAMAAADLVVTAAGTSVLELCAMARPMATVAVVDNQAQGYRAVVEAGAAVGLGTAGDLRDTEATARLLRPVLASRQLRDQLAQAAGHVVDDLGAWRVVTSLEEVCAGAATRRVRQVDGLVVRPAELADAEELWRWRNDEQTRANSRSRDVVPFESHLAWLESSLQRSDRHLLVAEVDGAGVGTVRWDREAPGEWEVSITVAPHSRGRGLGVALLESAQEWLVREEAGQPAGGSSTAFVGSSMFLAAVHTSNAASRRLFLGAGYLPDRPVDADGFERFSAWATPGPS